MLGRVVAVAVVQAALSLAAPGAVAQSQETARGRALYEMRCGLCHDRSVHQRNPRAARSFAEIRSFVVRWDRDPTGLAVGVYVDTVTVTAAGATGSPAEVVDSLVVQTPLTLAVTPSVRRDTALVAATAPVPDSASVVLTGAGAEGAAWAASHVGGPWLSVTTAAGSGSGLVRWQRDPAGLAAGWYVDTVVVITAGAVGSPAAVVDSFLVRLEPAHGAAYAAFEVGERIEVVPTRSAA